MYNLKIIIIILNLNYLLRGINLLRNFSIINKKGKCCSFCSFFQKTLLLGKDFSHFCDVIYFS